MAPGEPLGWGDSGVSGGALGHVLAQGEVAAGAPRVRQLQPLSQAPSHAVCFPSRQGLMKSEAQKASPVPSSLTEHGGSFASEGRYLTFQSAKGTLPRGRDTPTALP